MSFLMSLAHITQGPTKKQTNIHHSQVKNSFFSQSFNSSLFLPSLNYVSILYQLDAPALTLSCFCYVYCFRSTATPQSGSIVEQAKIFLIQLSCFVS